LKKTSLVLYLFNINLNILEIEELVKNLSNSPKKGNVFQKGDYKEDKTVKKENEPKEIFVKKQASYTESATTNTDTILIKDNREDQNTNRKDKCSMSDQSLGCIIYLLIIFSKIDNTKRTSTQTFINKLLTKNSYKNIRK